VTFAAPAAGKSPARIAAVNCVELTNVVARLAPFHCTTEPEIKLLPVTVNVKAPDPAAAEAGRIDAIDGVPFAVIAKETPLLTPPPGVELKTVTAAVPAAVRSPATIAAVNCVGLM
jgi:hypothetical protein